MAMKLITHDGSFHYDEILATAILLEIYPDAKVIRTRDMDIIKTGDVVYDVGRCFDPHSFRFDHHQATFNDTYSDKYQIKLSSAGLVYKFFCEKLFQKYGFTKASPLYNEIKDKIYDEFFLSADAIDNGVNIFTGIKPRTIQDIVQGFLLYSRYNSGSENDKFMLALNLVRTDFNFYIGSIFDDYLPKSINLEEEMSRSDGPILVLKNRYSQDLMFDVDKKLNRNLKFIISPLANEYRILTLPNEKGGFKPRLSLNPKWCGLANEELVSVSGIPGAIFVHVNGFTGGNQTLEGAIEMCKRSL